MAAEKCLALRLAYPSESAGCHVSVTPNGWYAHTEMHDGVLIVHASRIPPYALICVRPFQLAPGRGPKLAFLEACFSSMSDILANSPAVLIVHAVGNYLSMTSFVNV